MKESLKQRLLAYLRKHGGRVASGELQRLVMQTTSYTPQNVGRRLRELENEKLIEVSYEKGHAYYKASSPKRIDYFIVNGVEVAPPRKIW